jgi:hypothetical protein
MKNIYYCYVYLDPRNPGDYVFDDLKFDYEPFYVGKGKNRRFSFHLTYVKRRLDKSFNHHFLRKIKAILMEGMTPIILFHEKNMCEEDAYQLETKLIETIGLDNLTNIFPGGKGGRNNKNFSGRHHTDSAKDKIRASKEGENNPMYGEKYYRSDEGKKSFSEKTSGANHHFYQTKRSDEVKEKIRKKLKGIKLSDDQCMLRQVNMQRIWDERKQKGIKCSNKSKSIPLIAINIIDKTEIYFNSYKECGSYFKKCFVTIKSSILNKTPVNDYIIIHKDAKNYSKWQ